MEFRLLTTEAERRIYIERLGEARDQQLTHFKDVCEGPIDNGARLAACEFYGLFEEPDAPSEAMIAGIALHDLEAFPRTCPGPEIRNVPASKVFECSDHWSLVRGAGMQAWCGAAIQIARRDPRAVLAYLAVGSSDHMGFYRAMGFVPFGEPAQFLYLETTEGYPWVQPMILQGEALERLLVATHQLPIEASLDFSLVRFGSPLRLRPYSVPRHPRIGSIGNIPSYFGAEAGA